MKIRVEVFVDIMMQRLSLEIHKMKCLESIALHVILNWFQDILIVLVAINHLEIENNGFFM